jgi:UDP-N-acetylglucosamine--N-acetylmuramyl-(pentapeptide) pyrophosphoryl-undecaprenol N-acetylglucosamine transferase
VQPQRLRIVFAGGGTGGHLFPAIAIADEIKRIRPDSDVSFVGTKGKIEARVVPERGYAFTTIWVSGLRRKLVLENVLFPLKLLVSLVQSFILLKKLKPNVVVGTGGYVCGPVVFVASLLGVPTLLQEQNSRPGVTTRMLASRVDEVHISFEASRRFLGRVKRVKVTGNPSRSTIGTIARAKGARHFGIAEGGKTLLVFGGSLGARSINSALLHALPDLCASDLQIVWQTGETDYERVRSAAVSGPTLTRATVKVFKFIDAMEYAYAAADLAICRAGATTVAELTRAGVPSLLVPYPYAAAGHQTENARMMVEGGASVMILDGELGERLLDSVTELLSDSARLATMAGKARALGWPNAAVELAHAVIHLAAVPDDGSGQNV